MRLPSAPPADKLFKHAAGIKTLLDILEFDNGGAQTIFMNVLQADKVLLCDSDDFRPLLYSDAAFTVPRAGVSSVLLKSGYQIQPRDKGGACAAAAGCSCRPLLAGADPCPPPPLPPPPPAGNVQRYGNRDSPGVFIRAKVHDVKLALEAAAARVKEARAAAQQAEAGAVKMQKRVRADPRRVCLRSSPAPFLPSVPPCRSTPCSGGWTVPRLLSPTPRRASRTRRSASSRRRRLPRCVGGGGGCIVLPLQLPIPSPSAACRPRGRERRRRRAQRRAQRGHRRGDGCRADAERCPQGRRGRCRHGDAARGGGSGGP